jgi:hypothetical protein
MTFWRLRYTHFIDDGEYGEYKRPEDMFFDNLEEAMSYVLDLKDKNIDVTDIKIKQCSTVKWSNRIQSYN